MIGQRLIEFMKHPSADQSAARGSDVPATRVREGEAGHNVLLEGNTGATSSSPTVGPKLQKIAEQAIQYPELQFTTLAHLLDQELLREAYRRTNKSSAPGCDGVTAADYAEHLDDNLRDLHERLRSGRYIPPPVERTWLPKDDGSQRPIGKPTFEDKIVQRAVSMLLEEIYEQDFHDFSYGFRRGRSPHQALHDLRERCRTMDVHWILDADVSGFFDNIDHSWLQELLSRRVNDGSLRRLIGRWLKAGVLEGVDLSYADQGTPQGGVISPLLARGKDTGSFNDGLRGSGSSARRRGSGTGAGTTVICPWPSNTLCCVSSYAASTSLPASGATTGRWNRCSKLCGGLGVIG
jgi:retron-type reverse transcriptase